MVVSTFPSRLESFCSAWWMFFLATLPLQILTFVLERWQSNLGWLQIPMFVVGLVYFAFVMPAVFDVVAHKTGFPLDRTPDRPPVENL